MNEIINVAKTFVQNEVDAKVVKTTKQLIREFKSSKNPVTKSVLRKFIINRINNSPLSQHCHSSIDAEWIVWRDCNNVNLPYDKWNAETTIAQYYIQILDNVE